MEKFIEKDDCSIDRSDAYVTVLRDDMGKPLLGFPVTVSDDFIWRVLGFANKCYGKGMEKGIEKNGREVRAVLGISGAINKHLGLHENTHHKK